MLKQLYCIEYQLVEVGLLGYFMEELARRHLLESGCMEDVVYARHCVAARLKASYVSDEKLDLMSYVRILRLILVTHVVLLLLIAGKDSDFLDVCPEETVQHCVSE